MKEYDFKYMRKDVKPSKDGWYATLHCWDISEGTFASSHYWENGKFNTTLPVSYFIDEAFDSEDEAYDVAYENKPDW